MSCFNKTIQIRLLFAASLLLSGCGGGGSDSDSATSQPPISPTAAPSSGGVAADVTTINGVSVPPEPGSPAKVSLAGVDTNANGVRDEIDRELARLYGTDAQALAAATKFAKAMQAAMLALNAANATDVNASVKAEFASFACLVDAVGRAKALEISREVRLRTLNSKPRREGANKLDDATVGMDLSTFESTPCN